jgi:hypothetical protein
MGIYRKQPNLPIARIDQNIDTGGASIQKVNNVAPNNAGNVTIDAKDIQIDKLASTPTIASILSHLPQDAIKANMIATETGNTNIDISTGEYLEGIAVKWTTTPTSFMTSTPYGDGRLWFTEGNDGFGAYYNTTGNANAPISQWTTYRIMPPVYIFEQGATLLVNDDLVFNIVTLMDLSTAVKALELEIDTVENAADIVNGRVTIDKLEDGTYLGDYLYLKSSTGIRTSYGTGDADYIDTLTVGDAGTAPVTTLQGGELKFVTTDADAQITVNETHTIALEEDITSAIDALDDSITILLANKANIYTRLAVGDETGINIQGMHIRPHSPWDATQTWTLVGSTMSLERNAGNLIFHQDGQNDIYIVQNSIILLTDFVIEDRFYVVQTTGSYSNTDLLWRVYDIIDLDQRLGKLSSLTVPDKDNIIAGINSLKQYVDQLVFSSEVAGSPYISYAAFLAGAGQSPQAGKYAYVSFPTLDGVPTLPPWDQIQLDDTWRLDSNENEWVPTTNMSSKISVYIDDEAGTTTLKAPGSDTTKAWVQSLRNNTKALLAKYDTDGTVLYSVMPASSMRCLPPRTDLWYYMIVDSKRGTMFLYTGTAFGGASDTYLIIFAKQSGTTYAGTAVRLSDAKTFACTLIDQQLTYTASKDGVTQWTAGGTPSVTQLNAT